ncbi:MAG: isocitrate dehydrogenase (NAD(+)) [Deltaproteobacteria bacterium]|nr:isocitrate dehydrogenase (NAD(+)) [Deltaproteobacteria bacterium]
MPVIITLLPGDGIGPEVTDATLKVLDATGIKIKWERALAGQQAIEKYGSPLPEPTLKLLRKNQIALKGPIGTPIAKGFGSVNVLMRKTLDLYCNLRPVKSLKGKLSRYENIDLVIVRENTEGLYSGIEHQVVPGVIESIKVISEKASRRIAEFAFRYAQKNKRKKVTTVHKANIMKLSDGLFLNCAREVAARYPKIEHQELIVDNTCMQLVMRPEKLDVMVMENLYGDIVSDLCAGLIGGLGLVPGANLGDDAAVFEAVHGNAPDIAGKGIANPIAMMRSAAMMLEYLKEAKKAQAIEMAINSVTAEGLALTPDMGGKATTKEMTQALVKRVKEFLKK